MYRYFVIKNVKKYYKLTFFLSSSLIIGGCDIIKHHPSDYEIAEAKQKPIREYNLKKNTQAVMYVIDNKNNYSDEDAFMKALYKSLNPNVLLKRSITAKEKNKINNIIAHRKKYKSDTDFAFALNKPFIKAREKYKDDE